MSQQNKPKGIIDWKDIKSLPQPQFDALAEALTEMGARLAASAYWVASLHPKFRFTYKHPRSAAVQAIMDKHRQLYDDWQAGKIPTEFIGAMLDDCMLELIEQVDLCKDEQKDFTSPYGEDIIFRHRLRYDFGSDKLWLGHFVPP